MLLATSGYVLPAPREAWAQTVVPNVDVHVDAPRPVELVGRPDGSKGWASICRSPCDLPVPLTWTYAVQAEDYTTSSTFRLKPTSEDAHVVVRPENSKRVVGGVLIAVLGGLVATSGYVLMQIGSERAGCPGTDSNCNMAPNQGDTAPGTLMFITGLLTMVVGAAFAIDGSMARVSQVQ
jgi:hypothetical protein